LVCEFGDVHICHSRLRDCAERKMSLDQRLAASEPGRRDMISAYRRSGGLAVLAAVAAIGLAACGGGSSTPHVASLGTSSSDSGSGSSDGGGNSTAAAPTGNATKLLDEWAACMRKHGDPSQTDPTIDTDKVIHIFMRNVSQALSSDAHGSTGPCSQYELAAENALRGGQPAPQAPSLAAQLKYAECMRANGEPGYPDPNGSAEQKFPSGVDPNSTVFQNANKLCVQKTGMPAYWATGTGVPGEVMVESCNAPAGVQCPSLQNGGPAPGGATERPVPAGGASAGG
jgi:hypothetical protein